MTSGTHLGSMSMGADDGLLSGAEWGVFLPSSSSNLTHLGKRFYPSTTSTFIVPLTS